MSRPCAICGLSEDSHDGTEFHRFQESFRPVKESEEESTRRDVQTAIELQERLDFDIEELIEGLENDHGWNSNHAREIAELAWVEMYAEKEP